MQYLSRPQRWIRWLVPLSLLVGAAFVLALSAGAHTCAYDFVGDPTNSGSDIRIHTDMDCSFEDSNDRLTVQLWRLCTGCPDDFWGEDVDVPPADHSGAVYHGLVSVCEDPGISDDYVNKSFFDGDHNIDDQNSSQTLSPCG